MTPRRAALASMLCLALAACSERSRPHGRSGAAESTARGTSTTAAGTSGAPRGTSTTPQGSESAPRGTSTTAEGTQSTPQGTQSAAAGTSTTAAGTSAAARGGSAGTGSGDCHLLRGPVRLAATGALTAGPRNGDVLTFATNKLGAPSWEAPVFPEATRPGAVSLVPKPPAASAALLPGPGPAPAAPAASAAPSASGSASAAASADAASPRLPACALAGGFTFCTDAEGNIHRRPLKGDEDKVVAKGRRGTPLAAAAVGGHTYYAFLANQRTTEGVIVRAFGAVDDETPIPISEDGSGATFIGLVARDRDVLAMYIDARTALTPIHARTLRAEGHLVRGGDAVVLVAGGAEGRVRGAVGRGQNGPAFLFAAASHDEKDYGLVTLVVDGEPKDDLPGKWSHYPAAMTSSVLAATEGKSPVRLVRARPENKDAGAQQALELGHVDAEGNFADKCVLAKAGSFSDVVVDVDDRGHLWVAYTNGQGTWVEERGDGK